MALGGAAAAAAAATTGGTLFQYNRKNYMYDRKMRLETEYQIMEFKIKKAELFRDDVRDIIGLTSVKMDTYLIVNAVQLGFCVMMFCEGRLAAGTPDWLIGCHTLALAGAFTYLLMSVWLSMHATIAAKSYEVRLLTQLVRLPVPSWAQLEGARTYASTFEKLESRQMFRVPFATGSQEGVLNCSHGGTAADTAQQPADEYESDVFDPGPMIVDAEGRPDAAASAQPGTGGAFSADPWGLERPGDGIYELDTSVQQDPRNLRHIELVREAMQYWQSYDAFSRVSMSIGTNQLVTALAYYVLGYVLVSNHAIVAAWLACVLFLAIACALIRLDLSLTSAEYRICVVMVCCGPVCAAISAKQWAQNGHPNNVVKMLMPVAYASHAIWLLFILYISKIREQRDGVQLPTGFRSVLYMDVFGWIKNNPLTRAFPASAARPAGSLPVPDRVHAAGPAIQSVRYTAEGRPIPMRVEQLPGAARPSRSDISKADFAPNTFVPREKDAEEVLAVEPIDEVNSAGSRPWKVFCGATSLLAILWWVTGVIVAMELLGVEHLKVHPLTRAQEPGVLEGFSNSTNFLQLGHALSTKWPHENIHALGLACNKASHTVVASTRFGLYTADLSETSKSHVDFKAAPLCQDIEGEALQDVSMQCAPDGGACKAVVLQQQGRQLAKCDLDKQTKPLLLAQTAQAPSVALIAEDWLNDGDAVEKGPEESVQSLAISSHCTGGARNCAYVRTSGQRVVELQQTAEGGASRTYFPHRLLQTKLNGTSGAMDVIHDRYLALLQHDGRHVQVLDLLQGGAVVDSWGIPDLPKGQAWSAMCAAGDNLYLFTEGQSPQLWRFEVPQQLRPAGAAAMPKKQEVSMLSSRRKQRTKHVSLHVSPDGESSESPPGQALPPSLRR